MAEEQKGPATQKPHERVFQIPEPAVELVPEQPEIRERRIGRDGADARVLGRGQQGDGAAQREAEDADLLEATRPEEVDHAAQVAALAKADRGRVPAALTEIPLIQQKHGEARRQYGGDRQKVGLLGGIAVQQHERRRARTRQEPRGEPHAVVG